MHTDAGPLEVTMSLGVLRSCDWGQRPTEDLINQADSAAKAEGRNRVKLATPDERAEAIIAVHTPAEHLR